MPKMKTSFTGLVKLLAKHLYPEPNIFIRELIQNAHDSIKLRQAVDPSIAGTIKIVADKKNRTIVFEDNGAGMGKFEIEEFLSTIGSTGTGRRKEELEEQGITVETIGQFGIGLLSAFVVAERIDVYTRKSEEEKGWLWSSHGSEDYELSEATKDISIGTEVTITISPDHIHHIVEDQVRNTVRLYADFIPFPIMLNGNGPINVINAPWHRSGYADERDYVQAMSRFLSDRYPDTPLHVIPVSIDMPRAKGALYISNRHLSAINTQGVVDVYQERMCIRENDAELLPDWAKFIRGIVDSPDLSPTAARDNIIKDENYYQLREKLGNLIIQALITMAENESRKFKGVVDWHHYHMKGMAVHNREFFDAIINFLPFETNAGSLSLLEYIRSQKQTPGKKIPVFFFSYGLDSNQFYDICNARELIAINTGRNFDEDLVRQYVEINSDKLELRQLDTLDDPELYTHLTEEERFQFLELENAIIRALEKNRISNVRPITRRFLPKSMSAALIDTQRIEAVDRLRAFSESPSIVHGGLELLAKDLQKALTGRPLDLLINADNPVIQALCELADINHPRHVLTLTGVYSSAVLNSQQKMTPENAQALYNQFQKQMLECLLLDKKLLDANRNIAKLEIVEKDNELINSRKNRDWDRLFVMMPYDEKYRRIEDILRNVLEAPPFYFELVLARDLVKGDTLKKSLVSHIEGADGYIVDISTHCPNVMMEWGWVHFDRDFENRPHIVMRAKNGVECPVDMVDYVRLEYDSVDEKNLEDQLHRELRKNEMLKDLTERPRARFLSPIVLKGLSQLREESHKVICQSFQTIEELLDVGEEEFRQRISRTGDSTLGLFYQPLVQFLMTLPRIDSNA